MEQMLREFIREDCKSRGAFALDVIRKGGKIDRALNGMKKIRREKNFRSWL
jgi:hypothetical protein